MCAECTGSVSPDFLRKMTDIEDGKSDLCPTCGLKMTETNPPGYTRQLSCDKCLHSFGGVLLVKAP